MVLTNIRRFKKNFVNKLKMYDSSGNNLDAFVDIPMQMQPTVLEQQVARRNMERERNLMARELELMRRERDLSRRERNITSNMSSEFENTMSTGLQRDVAEKFIPTFGPTKETGLTLSSLVAPFRTTNKCTYSERTSRALEPSSRVSTTIGKFQLVGVMCARLLSLLQRYVDDVGVKNEYEDNSGIVYKSPVRVKIFNNYYIIVNRLLC